jgi:CO/xanthine dehydrogenase FAD-binding subunit
VKPPVFEYVRCDSAEEAIVALHDRGDESKVLAGGQSLVPLMNFRLASPSALIDVNHCVELYFVRGAESLVVIGALTRHRTLERTEFEGPFGLLSTAAKYVGHIPIRARGTFGGSVAHGDPSAEFPLLCVAMEAQMVARDPDGERTIPAADFFVMPFVSALQPDELLTEVRIPAPPRGTRWGFQEIARRSGDFAIVAVAALASLDERRHCAWARIGLAGVGPTPMRSGSAESVLVGNPLTAESIDEAAKAAAQDIDPSDDIHGSGEYRRHLVRVLLRRLLSEMEDGATGSTEEGALS